jgi:hypothetical protein
MFYLNRTYSILLTLIAVSFLTFLPQKLSAHCDGLDGPVVMAAKEALNTENVNLVLIWVQENDEIDVKEVFEHTLKVRKLSDEAKKLADTYFFETLVRIHRAGEGAPFTGLKPAGRDLGPAIPAADKAVDTGSAKEVLNLLNEAVHSGLHQRLVKVQTLKGFDKADVKSGREFVKAYVEFLHYVEPIYEIASKAAGHGNGVEETASHEEHNH